MIGEDIRTQVYRNTQTMYRSFPRDAVAGQLVEFARMHAGPTVLDFGCATGNYCSRLSSLGYDVKGVDVNPEYVRIARERGVDAHLIVDRTPFPDASFDTVLVFEVLEHLVSPGDVLAEAKRLARKNVLVTTPHCGDAGQLQQRGLLFEHFADLDHKNFFSEATLHELLEKHFRRVTVLKGDPIDPFALVSSLPVRLMGKVLTTLNLVRPQFYSRLYAVAEVDGAKAPHTV